jgi:sulfate permease, SulP family
MKLQSISRNSIMDEVSPWKPSAIDRNTLSVEVFGALTGALLVIPQGITFAYLAGLPPEYGIYTSVFVTLFASLFGSSSMLGGPNTAVAILIGVTVTPFAGSGSPLYIDLVLLLSLIVGLIQLLIWLARGGKYFQYLSPAAITGITVGVGAILILSSLDGMLGLSRFSTTFFFQKLYLLASDSENLINPYSLIIALITVISGLLARRFTTRYSILIAMGCGYLSGLIVMGCFTQVTTEIELLGQISVQLLPLSHPKLELEYLLLAVAMLPNALAIALIGMAQSMVIVKHLRTTTDQEININKEVFAQGISNLLAPFFSSFAGSGSFNRTAINQAMGVKTPLAGILSGFIAMALMISLGSLLSHLPMAVISGTLMLVGIGMIKPREIIRLMPWKGELAVFALTLFSIVFLGLQAGLMVALLFSIIMFLLAASRLKIELQQLPDAFRIQIEGHLFYASIDQLSAPLKQHRKEDVILDLSMVTYLDLSAIEAMARELQHRDRKNTTLRIIIKSQKLMGHLESALQDNSVVFIKDRREIKHERRN